MNTTIAKPDMTLAAEMLICFGMITELMEERDFSLQMSPEKGLEQYEKVLKIRDRAKTTLLIACNREEPLHSMAYALDNLIASHGEAVLMVAGTLAVAKGIQGTPKSLPKHVLMMEIYLLALDYNLTNLAEQVLQAVKNQELKDKTGDITKYLLKVVKMERDHTAKVWKPVSLKRGLCEKKKKSSQGGMAL